jgi:hypothetical protein
MSWMAPAAIVASSIMGSDAAGDAASAQAGASAASTAAQERMFNKQVELQAPFREAGLTAQNRLLSLLGLSSGKTYDQYRAELLPQYTTTAPASSSLRTGIFGSPAFGLLSDEALIGLSPGTAGKPTLDALRQVSVPFGASGGSSGSTSVNEAALDAAIRARMAEDANAPKAADFGKYARDFNMSDFEADPGYAFRLSEGQKALDRQAAARGGLISGSALKAATRYGQDMGSQEYTNAFNRYQTNRANQLQPLQSLAGVGQTATNTLTGAAGNLGAAQGANLINAGNAAAAGYVGQANAINQGLSTYMNYNQNQGLLNALNQNNIMSTLQTPQGIANYFSKG